MIVVLGLPGLTERGALDRMAGRVCVAAAAAGARVELVGSVGDDADGEAVVVELGRAGIGHAALLRDSSAATPRGAAQESDDDLPSETPRLPRLEAADIELGLRYVTECRVLVVPEPLDGEALRAAVDGAVYHRAALVAVRPAGMAAADDLPTSATVLEAPAEDVGAFALLVGHYAAQLDSGRPAPEAWHDAIAQTGWEASA